MHCDVSTLPPTVAAGGRARREHAAFRDDDRDGPQAAGVHRDFVTHQRAKDVQHRGVHHGGRRVEVRVELGARAGEVYSSAALARIHVDAHADHGARVHGELERAGRQPSERAAHVLLGVVLHVPHVRAHDVEAEMLDHSSQFLAALLTSGNLGAQVRQILVGIARRVWRVEEQGAELRLAHPARLHEFEIVDQHAFLVERA